ncbi:PepSY-associated TM helix domain-containing protein [Marinicella pacifica]|nr:PepSY-associated TM helix domain-containing protein [Marinicella pacifica]
MNRAIKKQFRKQMHTWHWISSAISLICMMLFAITGITLNHPDWFESDPKEVYLEAQLPGSLLAPLARQQTGPLPNVIEQWLDQQLNHELAMTKITPEWSTYEIYFQQPIPGGDRWLSINLDDGLVTYSSTDRGWVAWLNDLHKGRNTHWLWILFLDIFSVAVLVFCLTGLLLLQIHSKNRPSTWYITAGGLLLPVLIILFFL